ncbi:Ig-like domain-containing protein [Pseudomonas sp. B21-048]|uniref:Ig-like domain-containing protein n=1 Tax=Pseudomonas sp. B21-048 TaxID=2895490 RepID=UPI00215E1944|nr:Ig-like domain-containing protein [Pseudomonas sp. B21-048]UVL00049.1 Ig-like domain-containing protein [Pseudomonas sp. B21-048]
MLHPVIIQGWVTPVKPDGIAHGGIPKALYDGQAQGLQCMVDPWTELQLRSWTMAVDDHVDLYCNGDLVPGAGQTVKPGEETLRQRLYLPHGNLMHGVNRLHYVVTRVGGNSESSRDLLVLYHLRPVDNLDLVIPADVLKDGVSAARAAQGVEFGFTYANRRNYDRIQFPLGDTQVSFNVPDGTAPITHTLFTDTFQKAGDNPSTVAEFYVIDQLGNRVKSPEKRLDIHLDRLDLSAPTVKGQTGTNFSPTQPEVRVLVPQGPLLPTDTLSVIWQGAAGTPVAGAYTSPQRLVSAGLEIAVPRSVLAYSLGKQVTVTYVVERNGKPTTSLPLPLNIQTLPATALIPPKIVEADANNFLDVMALGTANATIHGLLWTLIEVGQQVWMTLEGTKADGSLLNQTIWNGGGSQVNSTWVNQGFWPKPLANSYLKQLGHGSTLTIKFKVSLDKSNNPATATVFPDRLYTIKAVELVVPTLVNVLDANNVEVPEGTNTTSTTLKLKGKASNGQQVEIFDGSGSSAVSKGTATAHATTGDWEHTITVPVGGCRLYAQSRYHPTPVYSNVRNLTVVAVIVPTLVNVLDANNVEVQEGTSTTSTTLKLKGKASNGQPVEIFDGSGASAVSKGTAIAHATTGDWDLTITLESGAHRLYAQSLYHSAPVYSNVRTLTVTLPLSVDTSMLRLDGVMVRSSYCPNLNGVDAIGNTALRQASGGKPSYHYQSSNQQVATVDANGKVTGMGNGTATITITDQSNARVSYSVAVSNIYSLLVHGGVGWTYARYTQSLAQRGEVSLTPQIRAVMARCFFQPLFKWRAGPTYPHFANAWTGVTSGASAEVYNTDTRSFGWLPQTADPYHGLSFSLKSAGAMGGLGVAEDSEDSTIVAAQLVDIE